MPLNDFQQELCATNVLYSLQHLGYVIPPQADAGCRFDFPNPEYR